MTNKRTIVLLRRVKHYLTYGQHTSGICNEITKLYYKGDASYEEVVLLRTFLDNNKPNKQRYSEFTESEFWMNTIYWWTPVYEDLLARKVRIDYIKALIKTIKEKE